MQISPPQIQTIREWEQVGLGDLTHASSQRPLSTLAIEGLGIYLVNGSNIKLVLIWATRRNTMQKHLICNISTSYISSQL